VLACAAGACVALPAGAAGYSDMVIDANSGAVLHATNIDEPRYPASLAKMMTLYIVFDMVEKKRLSLDTPLTISEYDASASPSKLGLKPGDAITVDNAIKALVTASANDVARAIAENLGGDEDKFARYMTWQARKLGMRATTFRNASGLPDPEQTSTARDYITLSLRLHDDFPQYFKVFKTAYFTYGRARYRNHNGLLFNFQGSDGIKTGYTHLSGFNLAASVHRNGRHVIGVIFGGRSVGDRNARMRQLLTAGLAKGATQITRRPAHASEQVAAKASRPATTVVKVVKQAQVETKSAKAATRVTLASAEPQVPAAADSAAVVPATAPAPARQGAGPFEVQVGSYASESEARQELGTVIGAAADVVQGHAPVSITYTTAAKTWYRARFAGFDRPAADQTCLALKNRHFDCIVMRAD
jgi:D-alanyl-D-alanine carboxypeptidase